MSDTSVERESGGSWRQLRRRKVVQWGLAYAAAAWTLLQVIQYFSDTYSWAPAVGQIAGLALPLAATLVLVVAWYHGDKGAQRVSRREAAALLVLSIGAITVVWWYASRLDSAAWQSSRPVAAEKPGFQPDPASIAVLPFANLTSDPGQDYFADGMSEEVLNLLVRLPQLRVIARTSSFSFKGRSTDIATIARALNVANILEGSVRRSGDTVRISVQLVRASDSTEIWSQNYDRRLSDVFEVQDDIAGAVVAALEARLQRGTVPNARRAAESKAYDEYLHGLDLYNRYTGDGFKGAVTAYRRAIALDPGFAPAYARLAAAEYIAADYADSTADTEAGRRRALEAAERAIALAPDLAYGYMARGFVRMLWLYDWTGARADLERAVLLEPGNAEVQRTYGELLTSTGHAAEAIVPNTRAVELDPLSAATLYDFAWAYEASGDFPKARAILERAVALAPDSSFVNYRLGCIEMLLGRTGPALERFRRASDFWAPAGVAMVEHSLGNEQKSQQALKELASKFASTGAYQIAQVHAWRGERDEAFIWLERAYAQRDGGLCGIKVDGLMAPLRSEPRYAALLKKLGLPP